MNDTVRVNQLLIGWGLRKAIEVAGIHNIAEKC